MRRVLAAAVLALPLGIALGMTAQLVDRVQPGLMWAGALGVPWLAVAFAAGAAARERASAATAGAVALVTGTTVYYALHALARVSFDVAPVFVAWALAAAVAGVAFGLLGARARAGDPLPVAVLAGALVGEALLLRGEWAGTAPQLILTAELAAGLGLCV